VTLSGAVAQVQAPACPTASGAVVPEMPDLLMRTPGLDGVTGGTAGCSLATPRLFASQNPPPGGSPEAQRPVPPTEYLPEAGEAMTAAAGNCSGAGNDGIVQVQARFARARIGIQHPAFAYLQRPHA
jgi:hypothetical protein